MVARASLVHQISAATTATTTGDRHGRHHVGPGAAFGFDHRVAGLALAGAGRGRPCGGRRRRRRRAARRLPRRAIGSRRPGLPARRAGAFDVGASPARRRGCVDGSGCCAGGLAVASAALGLGPRRSLGGPRRGRADGAAGVGRDVELVVQVRRAGVGLGRDPGMSRPSALSIIVQRASSSQSTRVTAMPVLPARPVRPMRCT